MIPTPDLSHLTKVDFASVYEPAEDTFLLLDALEEDATILRDAGCKICLEIGSGSGCVSCFLATVIRPSSAVFLTTDINPHAAVCTRRTGIHNKTPIEPIVASLVGPLRYRLRHAVDILLFNPPYVPTDIDEAQSAQAGAGIEGSWAGGQDGMEVTDILLSQVDELLSPTGRFYLVALKQNKIPDIQYKMKQAYGLHSRIVLQRRAGGEHLFIICFTRQEGKA